MTRRRFEDEEAEEDSEEEPEEAEEESRERRSKAPCSFADDAVLDSPLHQDNGHCSRELPGCSDY